MVSVTAVNPPLADASIGAIASGLADSDGERIERALEFARHIYQRRLLGTGEPALEHALGQAQIISELRLDADARAAALLFAVPSYRENSGEILEETFGEHVAALVHGITQLNRLRVITRSVVTENKGAARQSQAEVLRKMLLAMVADIRVVLLRLASRTQTLRHMTRADEDSSRRQVAQETMDIYAPLANRLGVWQLKWELEDLSFRFLEPSVYKRIAGMLDERRGERERFIDEAIGQLTRALSATGMEAQISGRPKHIFSIYNKMREKALNFDQLHDLRGLRVLVDGVRDCYTALGVVHDLWQPVPNEFDDYISRPKGNLYRSLHTAVVGPQGRTLEVQIRTHEMHRHAELGVAAHWRYKEGEFAGRSGSGADGAPRKAPRGRSDASGDRIAFLRQVLAWRDEIVDSSDWVEQSKKSALDDTVYVVTPQGRVIDLPQGATPIDFAYALHTDLGHHCRGAKVDGAIVPLDYRLKNGQRVEIIAAKTGGPSRDWMSPALGYIRSSRARNKVRQWFNSQELGQTIAAGRALVERELHREGQTGTALDQLAARLGFAKTEEFFAAVGREDIGVRQIQVALRGPEEAQAVSQVQTHRSKAASGGILIVGVDRLLTQLARCCKPVPPDAIVGFVTRGRGVSIHRADCASLSQLRARLPERMIDAQWGVQEGQVFPVDIVVRGSDRHGLLRDVSEVLSREQLNVTAAHTQSKGGTARMFFTVEVDGAARLQHTLALVEQIRGVDEAARR
ncbi:MAG: GTP pyrophosphokinase [Betaproteobacteria bacterium RIFCSPLOWO2_02_FULL_63_19]|nr:MAG: GTP pyrophosphokinase [Betaproteobacteria bacterium RIFCSPLOWO2_02_FULL_63_19]